MKVRAIVKLLAVTLVLSMCLSACVTTKPVDTTPMATLPAGQNYWELLDKVTDTSDLPDWPGQKLDVTVWVAGGSETIFGAISDTNVTFKELERVTGVRFNVEKSFGNGGDSIDAKLPKVIASKNLPTMIYGWNINAQMQELFTRGYLADLTEFYNKGYLDQVQEVTPVDALKGLVWDRIADVNTGAQYQIPVSAMINYYDVAGIQPEWYDPEYYHTWYHWPCYGGGVVGLNCVYIRDDILTELYPDAHSAEELIEIYQERGEFTKEEIFDIPLKSTEDFANLLRDIKELLDEGGFYGIDGRDMEVTYGPCSSEDNWKWMKELPGIIAGFTQNQAYFTYCDMNATSEDQIVQYAFSSDKYKEYFKLINELVNEDVFSKNSLVENGTTFDEKFLNGHYAVVYGSNTAGYASEIGKDYNMDWAYRPVWIDMVSDWSYTCFNGLGTVSTYGIFKDTLSEGQLEQLIHAINYLYSDVGVKNFVWGPRSAGLFTEDAEGNRSYTTEELTQCMGHREDNGENVKYGLINNNVATKTFSTFPYPADRRLQDADYQFAPLREVKDGDIFMFYNPGIFEEYSNSNVLKADTTMQLYNTLGLQVEGNAKFWKARNGFEQQMKKMLAATPDKFEAEFQALCDYAEEYGLTEETRKEYNDLYVEANRTYFIQYGLIKDTD